MIVEFGFALDDIDKEVEDDGLGGPVKWMEHAPFIDLYSQAMLAANPCSSVAAQLNALTKYKCSTIAAGKGDGKVYLSPHFRGFMWGYLGTGNIPKNMRPERFDEFIAPSQESAEKAMGEAIKFRDGFMLAKETLRKAVVDATYTPVPPAAKETRTERPSEVIR
jgi:hypothetical protein